jgi:hypothetical protein
MVVEFDLFQIKYKKKKFKDVEYVPVTDRESRQKEKVYFIDH